MDRAQPNVDGRRAQRAIGAMFFSVFGSAWIVLWSLQTFPGNWALAAVASLSGMALLAQSIRIYRSNKPQQTDQSAEKKRQDRQFHLINGAQWVVIVIAANLLNHIDMAEWILPTVILIIGLHFLPLARLFRYFPHYVMGLVMMFWAVAYAWCFGPANTVGCLGTGLILWCGAIYAMTPKASN